MSLQTASELQQTLTQNVKREVNVDSVDLEMLSMPRTEMELNVNSVELPLNSPSSLISQTATSHCPKAVRTNFMYESILTPTQTTRPHVACEYLDFEHDVKAHPFNSRMTPEHYRPDSAMITCALEADTSSAHVARPHEEDNDVKPTVPLTSTRSTNASDCTNFRGADDDFKGRPPTSDDFKARSPTSDDDDFKARSPTREDTSNDHNLSFSAHMMLVVECDACGRTAPSRYLLWLHLRRRHLSNANAALFHCDHCRYCSAVKPDLSAHMRNRHLRACAPGETDAGEHQRPFACDDCQRAYKKKQHLLDHVCSTHARSAKQEPAFACVHCRATFRRRTDVGYHVRATHRMVRFTCDECGLSNARKKLLQRHMLNKHA